MITLDNNGVKDNRIGLVTKCLALYFVLMPLDSIPVFGLGSLLKFIAIVPLLVIFITIKEPVVRYNSMTKLFFLHAIYCLFTVFISVDLQYSFDAYLRLLSNMILVVAAGGVYNQYTKNEYDFLKYSLVGGGIVTLILTFIFSDYSASNRLTMAVNGGMQDQNYINGYLLFAIAYFSIKVIQSKELYNFIPISAFVLFTLMTGSRGAMIAIFCVIVVCLLFNTFSIKKGFYTSLLVLLFAFVFLFFAWDFFLEFLPDEVSVRFTLDYLLEKGTTSRDLIWGYLIDLFFESNVFRQLFGYGYATTPLMNHYNGLVAHNIWLDHLIGNGLIGTTIFIAMQLAFLRNAYTSKDSFLLGSYVGYLVMCMSLSLIAYKPLWNCMIMIMIFEQIKKNDVIKFRY